MAQIGIDLITLSYLYLQKKARTTHKQYTVADLFSVCEQILKWNENPRGKNKNKNPPLRFTDGNVEISDKILV